MTRGSTVDTRLFRDVMGRFATGVTVVTVAHDGEAKGMTANAISSLSLEPVLLLVCVARSASIFPLFERADAFAVNILCADQRELSDLFAHDGDFNGRAQVPYETGVTGAPLLPESLAYADCRISDRYEGGDHVIVIGEVVDAALARPDAEPLLFHAGRYHTLSASQ